MVQRERFDLNTTTYRFKMDIKTPDLPSIGRPHLVQISFLWQLMKIICIHHALANGFKFPCRTLTLDNCRVPYNLSPFVETRLSTFITSIIISPLQSAQLQRLTLKFSHNYWIWIYQVPLIYFLFHPFITVVNHNNSRHIYQLEESLTLFSLI